MDFIEGLPKSNGKDTIWFLVDHLSNCKFCATLAQIFLHYVYKLHGSLLEIISDIALIFISDFWKDFLKVLGVEHKLTSYHPQTNDQAKILNRC